jgi:hypothetical protein
MKTSRPVYNWISVIGFVLVANSLILILFLCFLLLFSAQSANHIALYIYILLPVFLVIGILLIPAGIALRIRKDDSTKS